MFRDVENPVPGPGGVSQSVDHSEQDNCRGWFWLRGPAVSVVLLSFPPVVYLRSTLPWIISAGLLLSRPHGGGGQLAGQGTPSNVEYRQSVHGPSYQPAECWCQLCGAPDTLVTPLGLLTALCSRWVLTRPKASVFPHREGRYSD